MQAGAPATVACVDSFSLTDFRPELGSVGVPTLLLHGTADIPVPIALARITARGIPQSTMIEYADVSHGLVVTEREPGGARPAGVHRRLADQSPRSRWYQSR